MRLLWIDLAFLVKPDRAANNKRMSLAGDLANRANLRLIAIIKVYKFVEAFRQAPKTPCGQLDYLVPGRLMPWRNVFVSSWLTLF
jgi:hypothetical protein